MKGLGKKLYFIYNPHSGREKIRGRLVGILDELSMAGYELTVYPTRNALDARDRIEELPDGYDLVVVGGGDGTLNEAAAGMMKRARRIPIGYIPAGSTNDFARSLKIPSNMRKAAALAVGGVDFAVDTGLFNDRNFIYCAAFGLFTGVSYGTSQTKKNLLGHMAYVLEGVKSLQNVKSYKMKVRSREKSFRGDFLYGMVTNSKSVGGFKSIIGKNVIFDDGLFEVTFIRRPGNPAELNEILAALMIEQIDTKYMYSFKSARVEIEAEEAVPWALDGEYGGECRSAVISNSPSAVEIRISHEEREILMAEAKKASLAGNLS